MNTPQNPIAYQFENQFLHFKNRTSYGIPSLDSPNIGLFEFVLKEPEYFSKLKTITPALRAEMLQHCQDVFNGKSMPIFMAPETDITKCIVDGEKFNHDDMVEYFTKIVIAQKNFRELAKTLIRTFKDKDATKLAFAAETESINQQQGKNSEIQNRISSSSVHVFGRGINNPEKDRLKQLNNSFELIGHKQSLKLFLDGSAKRINHNLLKDNFECKSFVILSLKGRGYMDFQRNSVSLNKARTFNNAKDAENFVNKYKADTDYTIAEVNIQFEKILDPKKSTNEISHLISMSEKEEIKKTMTAAQIEKTQFAALAFEHYLISKGIDPRQAIKEIEESIPDTQVNLKDKSNFLSSKLKNSEASINKPSKTKTL